MIKTQQHYKKILSSKNPQRQIQVTVSKKNINNLARNASENNINKSLHQLGLNLSNHLKEKTTINLQETNLNQSLKKHPFLITGKENIEQKKDNFNQEIQNEQQKNHLAMQSSIRYLNRKKKSPSSSFLLSQKQNLMTLSYKDQLMYNHSTSNLTASNSEYGWFVKQVDQVESRVQSMTFSKNASLNRLRLFDAKELASNFMIQSTNFQNNQVSNPLLLSTKNSEKKSSYPMLKPIITTKIQSVKDSVLYNEEKLEFPEKNEVKITQSNIHQQNAPLISPSPQQPTTQSLSFQKVQQKPQQTSILKHQYVQLSQRLQLCIEQINLLQKNNNTQKVVELENQIISLKQSHFEEVLSLKNQLEILENRLLQKQLQYDTHFMMSENTSTQTTPHYDQAYAMAENQIKNLKAQLKQLTETASKKSLNSSLTISAYSTQQSIKLQNCLYSTQILRLKYQTLQKILQIKRKQIIDKDGVIQLLLKNQVSSLIKQTQGQLTEINEQDRVKVIVKQLLELAKEKVKSL